MPSTIISPVRELDMIRPQPLRNAGTTINRLTNRKNVLRTDLLSIKIFLLIVQSLCLCLYYYFSLAFAGRTSRDERIAIFGMIINYNQIIKRRSMQLRCNRHHALLIIMVIALV